MTFWKWSTTAANNATADSTCPFPEGMAPSAVNDGARAMMAAAAKYRNDISGMLVTSGTSTAYTLFSNQGFDSLAAMHGAMLCFTPHTTNGANGTSLNVDAMGPKPVLTAPGVGLPGAILVQGTPYAVTYNNTDGAFYLHGFYGNPYNIPVGSTIEYWGAAAPNSAFAFPYGQAISRTVYSGLFALLGTNYGSGDGTTTFNLPDLRGRVVAGVDNMGGVGANRLTSANFGGNPQVLGASGGVETVTLTTAQIPAHSHPNTLSDPGHTHGTNAYTGASTTPGGGFQAGSNSAATVYSSTTGITINNASVGGGGSHTNVQPTIVANKLIRII